MKYVLFILFVAATILLPSSGAHAALVTYKNNAATPFVGGSYAGTQDTMILSNSLSFQSSEDDNFGVRGDMAMGSAALPPVVGSQQAPRHLLLKFNLASLAGQYSSINSVTVRLYTTGFGTTPGTGEMYRMADANANWIEGNGASGNGFASEDVGGATYNFRIQGSSSSVGTPWAGSDGADLAGTDYLTPALATTAFAASTAAGTAIDFVISNAATATSLINAWTTGTNAGLFFKTANEANGVAYNFHSSEEGNAAAFEPELIINFVVIPEPSTFLLAAAGFGLALLGRRRARA